MYRILVQITVSIVYSKIIFSDNIKHIGRMTMDLNSVFGSGDREY